MNVFTRVIPPANITPPVAPKILVSKDGSWLKPTGRFEFKGGAHEFASVLEAITVMQRGPLLHASRRASSEIRFVT